MNRVGNDGGVLGPARPPAGAWRRRRRLWTLASALGVSLLGGPALAKPAGGGAPAKQTTGQQATGLAPAGPKAVEPKPVGPKAVGPETPATPKAQAAAAIREGDAHARRLDEEGALAAYQRALALEPGSFEAREKLTQAAIDRGYELVLHRSGQAEAYFRRAIAQAQALKRQFPQRAPSYFYLAAAYGSLALFQGGKQKVATGKVVERYARQAIALDPRYPRAYVALGVFYREVATLSWIERAFANAFLGGLPKTSLADAERLLEKGLALDPTSIYARFQLALTYAKDGRRAKAIAQLRAITRLGPRNPLEAQYKRQAQSELGQIQPGRLESHRARGPTG